ncbi:hypothetical protein HYX11_05165 [Candidatus Woesearchaeota archaeon]|nr:hypothetical protein [Candidatus Woesearchaeota archaeon]
MDHHQQKQSFFQHYLYLIIALTIILIIGSFLLIKYTNLSQNIVSPPQKIELDLIVITTKNCPECFDIDFLADQITSSNISLKSKLNIDYSSLKSAAIVKQYNITKVPALIIQGNLEEYPQLFNFLTPYIAKQENSYIINTPEPPYVETATNLARGQVHTYYLIKENCPQCKELDGLLETLKPLANLEVVEVVPSTSPLGKEMIAKYNINFLPTILFSPDAYLYQDLQKLWSDIGTIESDEYLVFRKPQPPYYDLPLGQVKGLVTATIIADKTCPNCKNISKTFELMQYYIPFTKHRTLDKNMVEAQGLIQKYKITTLSTIILTGDIKTYQDFQQSYSSRGTFEYDGTYVLRIIE